MGTAKKRVIPIIAAVFVCVSVLVSFVFIAGNAAHECPHDGNCAVCRAIDACIHTIRDTLTGSSDAGLTALVMTLCAITAAAVSARTVCDTLITLKTELRR